MGTGAPVELKNVQKIGKYEVQRVLGRGGMATVYEAVDPLIGRKLALKAILPELASSPDLLERFMREAQAGGSLQHRNIVTVYDLGEDDGLPYIVMELVPGTDLERVIQARLPYSIEWKLDVIRQVCDGLGFAHENGIVHRDVKPANVRVTPEDEVKIMDFGIARLRSSDLTQKGLVLGTLQYMSPEQADGQPVDHRSDIFSVGVIAYELLAYRKPFAGDTLAEVMYKLTHEPADPVGLPKTDYSPGLEAIVLKALATGLQDRYQTLAAMRQDLEQLVRDVAPRLMTRGKSGSGGEPAKAEETGTSEPEPEPDPGSFDADTAELNADLEEARSSGHLAKAWAICEKLLERRPNDPELMKTAEAIQAQIQDEEVAQLGGTALAYAEEGETELADKILARIWAIAPDSPRLAELRSVLDNRRSRRAVEDLTASARDHLVQGNLEEALAAVEEALELDPSHEAAREIRERTAQVLASQHSRSLLAGDEASEEVTAESGEEPASDGPLEAAEAEAPPTGTAANVSAAASPSEPPAVASEPEVPGVGRRDPEETSELLAQSDQAAEPAADSERSEAPRPPQQERGKVEGLMSKALNHFLRGENPEAREGAERVLALDPGHRRAQELLHLLASLH